LQSTDAERPTTPPLTINKGSAWQRGGEDRPTFSRPVVLCRWSSARSSAGYLCLPQGNGQGDTNRKSKGKTIDEQLKSTYMKTKNLDSIRARIAAMSASTTAVKKDSDGYYQPFINKDGNGSAVLRFLPPTPDDDFPFVRIWNHAFEVAPRRM
jgi:hypothetical protein